MGTTQLHAVSLAQFFRNMALAGLASLVAVLHSAKLGLAIPDQRLGLACNPKNFQCDQPSLGREVTLGHGWDIRGDRAVAGMAPWSSDTIAEKKINTTNAMKEMVLKIETDSSERADSLSVEANLEVNVLSGMVQVSAGGKYLTSEKQSSTSVRIVLAYDATTYFTTMPFTETPVDESNKDFCSNNNLASVGGPTHVVTSVSTAPKRLSSSNARCSEVKKRRTLQAGCQLTLATQ